MIDIADEKLIQMVAEGNALAFEEIDRLVAVVKMLASQRG